MGIQVREINQGDTLIQNLLQKMARDRAASQKYNIQALILIYGVLVGVVLLGVYGTNILVVGSAAILGFLVFWVFTWWRGKRLEKRLYEEEVQYYKDMVAAQPEPSRGETPATEDVPLSARELEILTLIAKGNMNKEIARILGLSTHTVRNYTVKILRKLDVDDRTSAAVLAISRGWIDNTALVQTTPAPDDDDEDE